MLWTFSQGQRIIDVSFLSHSFLGIFLFFVCLFYLYIEMPTVYVATILLYKSGWNTFSFWLKSNSALTVGKEEPLCTSGVWYEAVGHHSFFLFFFSPLQEYCMSVTLPLTNLFAGYNCILCLALALPSVLVRAPQEGVVRRNQQPFPTQTRCLISGWSG